LDQKKYQELFIEEAKELLFNLNDALLTLETEHDNIEVINEAFRLIHTVKGTAKILNINSIGELAHVTEDLLDNIKTKKMAVNQDMIDILFESTDHLTKMVTELASEGEVTYECDEFVNRIKEMINTGESTTEITNVELSQDIDLNDEQKTAFSKAKDEGFNIYLMAIKLNDNCKLKEGRIFQVFRELDTIGDVITSVPGKKDVNEQTTSINILLATSSALEEAEAKAKGVSKIEEASGTVIETLEDLANNKKTEEKVKTSKKSLSISDTVRVKSQYLDNLLDLVGELMISEIRVKQIAEDINHKDLKQFLKNNDRLIGEVQDHILRMRMVPIDHIFKRFPRMVRDISKEMEKEIEFQMEGNDIEIDRSLLDDVSDSVMHLLRNSIDHGIESTKERNKSNKKPEGSLVLKTYQEQSSIVIVIIDDGRGINPENIVAAAIKKGLITKDKANSLDEKEKLDLAFLPGLSTAKTVSEVSGRGVGLDVVNEKIHQLGGTVRIESYPGMGTKVIVKLPPSMAIIRAMLLEVNQQKYAIPLENIIETIRIDSEEIHNIAATGIFRLRDEVLHIQNLLTEFGANGGNGGYGGNNNFSIPKIQIQDNSDNGIGGSVGKGTTNGNGASNGNDANNGNSQMSCIIVEKNGTRAGLIVNRLIGQQEIVIKNLGAHMRKVGWFSGATILGDGKVAMILDVEAFL
jgi:two-component system chemotaxis sensor kinase CheA